MAHHFFDASAAVKHYPETARNEHRFATRTTAENAAGIVMLPPEC